MRIVDNIESYINKDGTGRRMLQEWHFKVPGTERWGCIITLPCERIHSYRCILFAAYDCVTKAQAIRMRQLALLRAKRRVAFVGGTYIVDKVQDTDLAMFYYRLMQSKDFCNQLQRGQVW